MYIKPQLLIFRRFCGRFNEAAEQWTLFGIITLSHPHTLSQFVWIDSKSSQEETILQKGGWTLPCKEPEGWFLLLKQSYDSLGHYVAKSLCWKQWTVRSVTPASSGLPALHDGSVVQRAMPRPGCSNQQHLTTPRPPSHGECHRADTDRNPVCVCVCACKACVFECNGDAKSRSPAETGSPGRLLHWRNFLAVRCVSPQLTDGEEEEGKFERRFQDRFQAWCLDQEQVLIWATGAHSSHDRIALCSESTFSIITFSLLVHNQTLFLKIHIADPMHPKEKLAEEQTEVKSSCWLMCVCIQTIKLPVVGLYLLFVPEW